ncbi:MAG: META domain-containing protein [Chitinophagaceae bacterium]|nr:META domain-containing protein [Chitinophagaceae bacterium]
MKAIVVTISFIVFIASCSNTKTNRQEQQSEPVADNAHTAKNALDWNGIYTGVVPSGPDSTQVVVQLHSNNMYVAEISIKDKGRPEQDSGTIVWNPAGSAVTVGSATYKVVENALVALDTNGNPTSVRLQKLTDGLPEKYWKLIELNGHPVTTSSQQTREAYIIFKSFDNRFNGNSGCNGFSGIYTLLPGNRIRLSQVIATKMACADDMETETMFYEVLNRIDNYTMNGDTLSVSKARTAPLAKFQAVYLR